MKPFTPGYESPWLDSETLPEDLIVNIPVQAGTALRGAKKLIYTRSLWYQKRLDEHSCRAQRMDLINATRQSAFIAGATSVWRQHQASLFDLGLDFDECLSSGIINEDMLKAALAGLYLKTAHRVAHPVAQTKAEHERRAKHREDLLRVLAEFRLKSCCARSSVTSWAKGLPTKGRHTSGP